ncbi:AtpZ/AtpI family protein [Candidatus Gottesmanbacteria bacterium]|nr:AtpZ/AtpI family protein [Candidatus Gottesmanbacteria bacterium]
MFAKRKTLRFGKDKILTEEVEKLTPKGKKEEKRFFATLSLVSQLGLSICLPIVGGAFLGQFLDKKFTTSPRMTLSLIFLGLFIGITNIYFILSKILKK